MNNIFLRNLRLSNKNISNLYWRNLPFYNALLAGQEIFFDAPVTFFVGENGCGKSTLIEAIAVAMGYNAEGGSKNFNFSTRNTTATLHDDLQLIRTNYESDGFFFKSGVVL